MNHVEVDPATFSAPALDPSDVQDLQSLELDAAHREIAELKHALQDAEQQLTLSQLRERSLAGELQHRVRNMLAVVRSVFSRTADSYEMIEDVADHFKGRLDALARSQTGLLQISQGRELEGLVRDELLAVTAAGDPRVTVHGPVVRLTGKVAESLGLAVHELVTNSIKFGILSQVGTKGSLQVDWSLSGQRLDFAWKETGVTVISSAPLRIGFGREYIENSLPYEIDADTAFEIQPGTILCRIQLMIDN
jgi:two-component sensor histidine kinase